MDILPSYSEANCALECAWKMAAAHCGCVPWFLKEYYPDRRLCHLKGNSCFRGIITLQCSPHNQSTILTNASGLVEHRYEVKELEHCVGSCPNDCDVTKMKMNIREKRTENDVENEQGGGMIMWWEELVSAPILRKSEMNSTDFFSRTAPSLLTPSL